MKGSLANSIVGGEGPYEVCDHLRVEYPRPGLKDLVQAFLLQVSPSVLVIVVIIVVVIVVIIVVIVVVVVIVVDIVVDVEDHIEDNEEEVHEAEHRELS